MPVMAAFRIDNSKRLDSRRVTPMCAVHTSFLLTLLTMLNTIGFAKKRVISKTAVPTVFHKNARFRNAHSVSRWTPRPARPSSRAGQRTAHASKQVFVNENTGVSLVDHHVICQTVTELGMMHRFMKPTPETICRQRESYKPAGRRRASHSTTIVITHSLLRFIDFSQCRWCLAGGSCMYGLSDKCPASVDKTLSISRANFVTRHRL